VRSSARIPKEIPILLIGSDLDGRVFSEHTTTVLLSLHGAGLLSRHKLSPEQELVLRWTEKNKEAEIRVVGHLGAQSGQHTYGVAFFDQNLNFWEIDFPPVSAIEKELGLFSLVCSFCNTLEKIDDTGIEADVCATNDGVLRSCKRCGSTTLWKPVGSVMHQQPVPPESAQLPLFSDFEPPSSPLPVPPSQNPALSPNSILEPTAPPAPPPVLPDAPPSFYAQSFSSEGDGLSLSQSTASPASTVSPEDQSEPRTAVLTMSPPAPEKPAFPRANRRKHPRVKVSYSACIRHSERGEDVVACEDMSKGGLRFKSPKKYYIQSLIDVAVPYQKGQPAIFVPGQIVFVEELPEQRLFRYGVQYLKPTKPRDSF
jgi:PilZ domain